MKCSGNGSLADFFAKHPGGQSTSSDTVNKYSSRAAIAYKEELAKRIARDEQESGGVGGRVTIVGAEGAEKELVEQKVQGGKSDADFFDTWDKKPATNLKTNIPAINLMSFGGSSTGTTPLNSLPPTPRTQSPAPPTNNTTSAISSAPSSRSSTPPASATTAAPTRMTSSSLRTTSTTAGTARPKPSTRTGSGMVLGRGKMGVKKGGTVNFEEAEKRAKEDEERVKRLGYDERLESSTPSSLPTSTSSKKLSADKNGDKNGSTTAPDPRRESIDTERLGMGMRKLGFGQIVGMSGEESAREQAKVEKAQKRREMGYDDDPRLYTVRHHRIAADIRFCNEQKSNRQITRAKHSAPKNRFPRTNTTKPAPTTSPRPSQHNPVSPNSPARLQSPRTSTTDCPRMRKEPVERRVCWLLMVSVDLKLARERR